MTSPVEVSLRYPQVTITLTLMLLVVGIYALLTMPRREDPKITIRTGLVIAMYPGASPEQVEDQVTRKIEERLFQFAEVRKNKTYSTSRNGIVIINVELQDWVKADASDQFWSKTSIALAELKQRELPSNVVGPIVNSDFGDTVAVLLAIRGSAYSPTDLREYAISIEEELRRLPAISKIKRIGDQQEEILVTSSLEKITQYGLTIPQIINSLQVRNTVQFAGNFKTDKSDVPLEVPGLFESEEQIRNLMIGSSPTGQPIYLGNLADVSRRYQEDQFSVRFGGKQALMISVEMEEGNNIVDFGNSITAMLATLKKQLPPDLQIDYLANQPLVVQNSVNDFIREFGTAIISVIIVTMLLLPFRVAMIAAVAIPVTIAATFAVMNALGIELHQVSIAALIIVLGMVVDDAIVISDNYVELLDEGVSKADAARRCATEMAVPVLTATLTIIASFLPLLIITGSVGEFIASLPIAVATALFASYIVAMLLTPLLCRFFIKKGLQTENKTAKPKAGIFRPLQAGFERLIGIAMRFKWLTVAIGLAAIVSGVLLLLMVPERFFPAAERNQFVIDVELPEGARLETSDETMKKIEKKLAGQPDIVDYAVFIGESAPRFYYNVSPELPGYNYGQFVVNTVNEKVTPKLVTSLRRTFAETVPEARVIVKELQQGIHTNAPIEIRVSGDEQIILKQIGAKIEETLKSIPGSGFVYNDWREDSYRLNIDVNQEVANRLGLSNVSIARQLAGSFEGATVSTFWEGDRAINITLRLEESRRESFDNIRNAYLTSQITGARVPLREIAEMKPVWDTSRIVRLNGTRTLSVLSYPDEGALASEILKQAWSNLDELKLPAGYRVSFGGEYEGQEETFNQMVTALSVSIVAIFLILLLHYRSISEPLVVMSSIPLSLLGAALGLVLTRNPFGFTAFMGLVSLCGVVVRNAIILIDYIKSERSKGVPLEQAAHDAGGRRLRPIFLTTLAAAVGVTPMIISGSSLWSPLAAVIAIGLLTSMVFTLVVVPVLYVLVERGNENNIQGINRNGSKSLSSICAFLLCTFAITSSSIDIKAQTQVRRITLEDAVNLAKVNASVMKLARQKIVQSTHVSKAVRADYYPQLTNQSYFLAVTERQRITLPQGSLGQFPIIGPFPNQSLTIYQGGNTMLFSATSLGQPLTQLIKIKRAVRLANAGQAIADSQLKKIESDLTYQVEQLYLGLLNYQYQHKALVAKAAFLESRMNDSNNAVTAGVKLEVTELGSHTEFLEAEQNILAAENQISDLTTELNNLLGLPLDAILDPVLPPASTPTTINLSENLAIALTNHPEIQEAEQTLAKARAAADVARADYIPELSAALVYTYQNAMPFYPRNNGSFLLKLNWNIFNWGKTQNLIDEQKSVATQAEENLKRIRDRVQIDIEKSYRNLVRVQRIIEVAQSGAKYQRESERIKADQLETGAITLTDYRESHALRAKAEADLIQAELNYRMAKAQFEHSSGVTR